MVSRCANSGCRARLMRLGDGKIYAVEHPGQEGQSRRLENYWLCNRCAETREIVVAGHEVKTVPKPAARPSAA